MKELTSDELKEVQLKILDYVDCFCRKNNIQYTISNGTLLGAVRHGGYIPWDDDIDIQLLRNEYNKFTQLWNESKEEHPYELVNIESGNNMGYPFGKIHDPNTITYVGNLMRTGVYIDVFPVDYVVDKDDYQKRSSEIAKLIKKRYACFRWMLVKDSKQLFYKKIIPFLRKPSASYEDIAIEISNLAKKVQEKTDYVYDLVNGQYAKDIMPAIIYGDYADIKFEDRVFRSVKDTETYLTTTYGDWRTPPPPEKRVSHHGFKAYWK